MYNHIIGSSSTKKQALITTPVAAVHMSEQIQAQYWFARLNMECDQEQTERQVAIHDSTKQIQATQGFMRLKSKHN
jgi:hypothetical protein